MKLIRQIVLTVAWTELLAKPMPLSRMGIDGRGIKRALNSQ